MEVIVGVGSQDSQGHVRRKEWRVVTDSPRQRSLGSGTFYRSRGNGRMTQGGDIENCNEFSYHHTVNSPTDSHSSTPPTPEEANGHIVQKEEHQIDIEQDRLECVVSTPSQVAIVTQLSSLEHPDCTLEQRLHDIARQREQLQQAEVELRARFLAQAEVMRLQSGFDEQAKQQSEIIANLQVRLREKEQQINLLEQQLEERERQLHSNQREANEALNQAWAKDGLLREQTNELVTLRRERDNLVAEQKAASSQSDVERAECLAQLEDLREQIREKDIQLQQVGEQHRATQDILSFKDEQLRDAQAWMTRAQELDAYHVSANSSLQLELRDRIDQMNQLWLGYQRQLAEVEMYHTQSVKRLQQQLAEVKEQNRVMENGRGFDKNIKRPSFNGSKELTQVDETNEPASNGSKQIELSGIGVQAKSSIQPTGTVDGLVPIFRHDPPGKVEHATGLPVVPTPVVGLTTLLPPSGGLGGMHRYSVHHQSLTPLQPSSLQASQQGLGRMQPPAAPLTHQQYLPPSQHQQVAHAQRYHSQQTHPTSVQSHSQWQQQLSRPSVQQQHTTYPSLIQSQGTLNLKNMDIQEHHVRQYHEQVQPEGRQNRHDFKQSDAVLPDYSSQPHMQSMQQHSQAPREVLCKDLPSHTLPVSMDPKNEPSQQMPLQQHDKLQKDIPVSCQQQLDKVQQEDSKELDNLSQNVEEWQSYHKHKRLDQHTYPEDHMYQQIQHSSSAQANSDMIEIQEGQQISSRIEQMLEVTISSLPVSLSKQDTTSEDSENESLKKNIDLKRSGLQTSAQVVGVSNKVGDSMPLDERSLLACLVRAVPAEPTAKIRISSTLPNRLGKMLAPLHWHDYRKLYGRLDEFLGSHTELFVIEGDFIYLREGAHAAVSTMTAVAKAAAAAAAVAPVGPSLLPTVAVTPVAKSQMQRLRSSKNFFYPQKETVKGLHVQESSNLSPLSSPQPLKPETMQEEQIALRKSTPPPNVRIAARSHGVNGHSRVSAAKYSSKLDDPERGPREGSKSSTLSIRTIGLTENGIIDDYLSPRVQVARENGFSTNKQQSRNQEIHARPQTQESFILGIVPKLAQ
ncbi:hypothetical protein O6H91_14G079800 [Diphasiastrum complanatum]|uniref:Uncharacterized protein n=1 Tax=Diphasiastrum complanatum TaxID=34168 RepID=A0ACC2BR75_DIPCM|nr:hypothetical protein O6H91_14G079800 [Diphasiastrum complanatum]